MALQNFNFGVKEVADVRFYPTEQIVYNDGKLTIADPSAYELEFTTLKVSNMEFTAEKTDARGGKGNAKLISWEHSREITVTLEDALLSVDCLKKMFGSTAENAIEIRTGAFAGNYAIVGTTFAREQESGEDRLFTFYIPNAKISSELSLTMEAEGDPTVFSMTLDVLRAGKEDDMMVALIPSETKYVKGNDESIFDQVITKA